MSEMLEDKGPGRPLLLRWWDWFRRPWTTYAVVEAVLGAQIENASEIRALRETIYHKLLNERFRAEAPVLTQAEAVEYVGSGSARTFRRWATRFGVKPCSPGRYARTHLDQGLRKEAKC